MKASTYITGPIGDVEANLFDPCHLVERQIH